MKLIKDWLVVLPGKVYPDRLEAGSDCPASLLDEAKALGLLESAADAKKRLKAAEEEAAKKAAEEEAAEEEAAKKAAESQT